MRLETLYAVVVFEPGPARDVRGVLIPFENVRAADLFALENGYLDYTVAPMSFFVDRASWPTIGPKLHAAEDRRRGG